MMFFKTRLAVFLTLFSIFIVGMALGGEVVSPGKSEMPEVLYTSNPDRPFPVFVSARAAFSGSGEIDESLFSPVSRKIFKNLLASEPSESKGCFEVEEHYLSLINVPDRTSLEKGLKSSALVILGVVTGKEYGFRAAEPGQLIRVETRESFHSRAGVTLGEYYFFFPVGRFSAGPYSFCKTDHRYGEGDLDVGDELLLMPYRLVGDQEREEYLEPGHEGIVIIKPGGKVIPLLGTGESKASAASASPPKTRRDLLRLVQSVLEGSDAGAIE